MPLWFMVAFLFTVSQWCLDTSCWNYRSGPALNLLPCSKADHVPFASSANIAHSSSDIALGPAPSLKPTLNHEAPSVLWCAPLPIPAGCHSWWAHAGCGQDGERIFSRHHLGRPFGV
jgi:hypothetical protein